MLTKFISAARLFDYLKFWLDEKVDFKVDLIDLRTNEKTKQIFWNLIYYFNEYHLPYEFILPYEDKDFEKELRKYKIDGKKQVAVDGRPNRRTEKPNASAVFMKSLTPNSAEKEESKF